MSSRRIAVCLEVTPQRTFACALDWPGWCRAGSDEGAALEALRSYVERNAAVAGQAGVSFPSTVTFDVVERVPGGPTTAFAAPECRRPFPQMTAEAEQAKVTPAAARRLVGLVTAAWATFDKVAAASGELRKGPRGGGRDRDKLIDHVIGAETAYAQARGEAQTAGHRRHRRRGGRPFGRLTRRTQRLDHPLRGPPGRLARPRTCLGDAGPGGERGCPEARTSPAS
jgi:hypothetical protein